jgi:hypothetical protein
MALFPLNLPQSQPCIAHHESYLIRQATDEISSILPTGDNAAPATDSSASYFRALPLPSSETDQNCWQQRAKVSRTYARILLNGGSLG